MPGPAPLTEKERSARFWARVDKNESGCWLWTGGTQSGGYGQVKVSGRRTEKAHRYAFLLANGWLPTGRGRGRLIIRHSCDVRRCCNPDHLLVGSYSENAADCVGRGRHVPVSMPGLSNPRAKLTPDKIAEAKRLRGEGRTMREIGAAVGVSQSSASRLLGGRTYVGALP